MMKKFLMQFLIVSVPLIHSSALRDHAKLVTDPYLKLITDLRRFYNATSIYFINGNFVENLFFTTIFFNNIKRLSDMDTLSQVLHYRDLTQRYNSTFFHYPRQLFIVPLESERSLQGFGNFTKQHLLAHHIWFLIFWGKVVPNLRDFCENPDAATIRLSFDARMLVRCYDNPNMYEWWSVHHSKRTISTNLLLEWTPEVGLQLKTHMNLYQRRYDVAGTILKVSSVKEHRSALAARANGENIAMFSRMMSELAAKVNFILHFVKSESFYGYYNETEDKWTGILGKLESKEIDIAVSEITMTKERVAAFDFTCPLVLTRTRLFIKEPGNADVQWNSYLRAFDHYTWLSLLTLIIVSAILLTLMKIKISRLSCTKNYLIEHHLCVWGIYCQQGLSAFPDSSPLRIAYVSIFFSAIVLSAVYSASIISYLTHISPVLPFYSLPQFLRDGSHKLIVIRNSYEYELFAKSEDWVLKGMYSLMKKAEDLPVNDIQAFEQVCHERVAYYSNGATVRQLGDKIPCKLADILTGRIDNLAFALTKYNPFTEFINYNILKFQDHGIIKRMKGFYFKRLNQHTKVYDSVGIGGITPLLTILIFGILLSLTILFIEKTYHKMTCFETEKFYTFEIASSAKNNRVKVQRRRSLRRF